MNCRMQRRHLRFLSVLICPLIALQTAMAGQTGSGIRILVLDGHKAQNLISTQAPKHLSVRVVDLTGKSLPGATVQFVPPEFGPGGTFITGQNPVDVTTNADGIAEAPAFMANSTTGPYEIQVIASYMSDVSRVLVEQTNVTSTKKSSSNKKLIIISAVVGGGLAAALAAKGGGGGSSSTPTAPVGATVAPTISFLDTSVGAPK